MTLPQTQKTKAGRGRRKAGAAAVTPAAPMAAPASEPVPDVATMRYIIAARLTRLQCERAGGCTRACRRQNRCVVADEIEREAGAK